MNEIFFETIKCDDFEIYHLEYHKKRISKTVGLNINLEEYIYPPTNGLLKCKITYDKNGILDINYLPYVKKNIHSFKLVFDNAIIYDKKRVDRQHLEQLYSQKKLNDEIIIVQNNLITDTSIANIAILYKNKWLTPKKPLLNGVTRERYLTNEIITEEKITTKMLRTATKIGLLNAMIDFDIIRNFNIEE